MGSILETYEVVLLDMHRTFMFDVDRFSPSENYAETYGRLGGKRFTEEQVNTAIAAAYESMMEDYLDPAKRECFPKVIDKLQLQALPESELELLVEVFAAHESGYVPEDHADCLIELARERRLGVVSNIFAPKGYWIPELERAGVWGMLDVFVCSSDYTFMKPSSRIFEEALAAFPVPKSSVVFIGDSYRWDVEGAAGAGIDSIWINAEAYQARRDAPPAKHVLPCLTALHEARG
jgi:HAD superfamily hydrolase (TIGR01509 family)